jgi:hypothetical protein
MTQYVALIQQDHTVSLASYPAGTDVSAVGLERKLELTEGEWRQWRNALATCDLRFDTVKEELIATPRETRAITGDQSN